jgi:hypothetical protein
MQTIALPAQSLLREPCGDGSFYTTKVDSFSCVADVIALLVAYILSWSAHLLH